MAEIVLPELTREDASRTHRDEYQSDLDVNHLNTDRPLPLVPNRNGVPVWKLVNIVLAVSGISFLGSFTTGLLTIALPQIAQDTGLPKDLMLWYVSTFHFCLPNNIYTG